MTSALRCPPTTVVELDLIKRVVSESSTQVIDCIAQGFVKYAEGGVKVAPVVHLGFPGDVPLKGGGSVCIKSGFVKDDDYYVIKIASGGSPGNEALGIPLNTGCMLVFSSRTTMLEAILLDEGLLTELRTAACGALAAKLLAPRNLQCIGLLGSGIQARFQLDMLEHVTSCRRVLVCGRNADKLAVFKREVEALPAGWQVSTTCSPKEVAQQCRLIVTTTTANEALIKAEDVQPGTHITAIGADGEGKQELDPEIMIKADLIAADSVAQCTAFGEVAHAVKAGKIPASKVIELGHLVGNKSLHRGQDNDQRITVVDSTGVAVQDIQISKLVYEQAKSAAKASQAQGHIRPMSKM